MKRGNLKTFTKISFLIALATISIIPISLCISVLTSNANVEPILKVFISVTFWASLFAVPLSFISMFSKEKLVIRIFALFVNSLPIGLFTYAFIVEFIDEFFQTAP
ncbi:2-acyl-glycerophospho-ethanolamine acyltransferase [Bacillus thuringiensis]|uniref:2-acyl-glycerophospho-ethanolamine acyltransferase n=1 Tax=Bacillus anthracis TaxID=1392 RepID=UPI001298A1B2|nr:2-acyl-glycerophospho-ethanolamine acyltransferase [Bacillus thuringiensis]MRC56460.1 2-acyl-glycerophospho-ethanolamine acyltransferase [Bacillus thuringiensis]